MKYKGARWYKTDLHLHTPESICFTGNVTAKEWVERCLEQKLDCVAVTDHNTGGFIDKIKEAAIGTGLTVFPGVEVTCSDSRVHILVIFDVDKGINDVNHFLARLKLDINMYGQQEAKVDMTVLDVIKEANEVGAIAIPAHIDQFSGICQTDHDTRCKIFKNENVLGVQAVHEFFYNNSFSIEEELQELNTLYGEGSITEETASKWKNTLQQALNYPVSILTFSDNPESESSSKHGLWGIGKRYTWIKMGEIINLESLRQALLLPESRVRNDFVSKEFPYVQPNQWIGKIKVSNTVINNESIEFYFNPQMTTIIGGRGTGKSSVLRFLRGCFKYKTDLYEHEEILVDQEKFFSVYDGKAEESGVLKKDSVIEVFIIRYNTKYKVTATNFMGESQDTIIEKFNEETERYEEVSARETNFLNLFNFDMYSQKQIYEIAKKPNALRDKMDSSIEGMYELNEELKSIKNEYLTKSSKIRTLNFKLEEKGKLSAELEDKINQLKAYQESNLDSLLKQFNIFEAELDELKRFDQSIVDNIELLTKLNDELELKELVINEFSEDYREEMKMIGEFVRDKFDTLHANISDTMTQMTNLRGEYKTKLKGTNWLKNYNTNNYT